MLPSPLLQIKNLKVHFITRSGTYKAVDGINFNIYPEKTLGLVGESGCGKSVTAKSILRLIPLPGKIVSGEVLYHDHEEIVDLSKIDPDGKRIRSIRGNRISMIFQDPMSSLNPVYTIGDQIIENIRIHSKVDKLTAKQKAIDLLNAVKISSPHLKFDDFPLHFSGGMRQRVLIAMALSCNPNLLIADEPTTALDVTVQEQILELINELKAQYKTAALFITHDLGVIAKIADFVAVMYLGKIVEYGPVDDIFNNPAHPYTKGLIKSTPSILGERKLKLDTIEGQVPASNFEIKGCVFYSRCEYATKECLQTTPEMIKMKEDHVAACLNLK